MDAKNRTVGSAVEREIAWRLYRKDIRAWINSSWHIKRPRKRPSIMQLWDDQESILKAYTDDDEKYVWLKARQLGWTTTTTAFAAWTCIFEEYTPWLFVNKNLGDSTKNLGFVKFGYANLPEWQRERVPLEKPWTTELIEWSNGSRIESVPATGGAGRGDAVWGVMWDEAAFAPEPEEQMAAIDPLVYGKLILLSTANGMGNLFQRTYADSKLEDSEWRGGFFPWWSNPNRLTEEGEPDWDGWYAKEARSKRATPWLMFQEYPSNDVEAFVKSGRTPIGHDLVSEFEWVEADTRYYWDGEGFEPLLDFSENQALVMHVWEEPTVERGEFGEVLRDPNYVVFADPAEGVEGGDYTAIAVYNANTQTCAARIQTHYALELLPEVLEAVGYRYFTALLGVERNNHGLGTLNILNLRLNYPRLYTMPKIGSRKTGHSHMLGWHTNVATKPKMVRDYARAMMEHDIVPLDPMLKHELSTFVQDENGKYGASNGNHDDVVMAHLGALQLIEDVGRFPIIEKPSEDGVLRMQDLDAMAFPDDRPKDFGVIGVDRQARRAKRSFEIPAPL